MDGVWQVDLPPVGMDSGANNPTLLISHYTPLDAFLPFFGQAVRVDTLSLDAGVHVNKTFVGALVLNQHMWKLLNKLVVNDLERKGGKTKGQPHVLGRLALVGCSVRMRESGNCKVYLKEIGDPSYRDFQTDGVFLINSSIPPEGVWHVDMHHPNTSVDIANTPISSPTPLISHTTPLNIILSRFGQAIRIDSLAHGTSAHIRKIFLGALMCDQNTWATFNRLMMDDLVPENQRRQRDILDPQQPWTLGKLTLMEYSSVTTASEGYRAEEEINPEAPSTIQPVSNPTHAAQSLPRPIPPKSKKKGSMKLPEIGVQTKNSTPAGDSAPAAGISELASGKRKDPPDTTAITKAQNHCKFGVDGLDDALFRMEETRAVILAAIAPPNEKGVLKWLLEFLVGFLFSFLWFILVVSCLFWARRHGRRSVPS